MNGATPRVPREANWKGGRPARSPDPAAAPRYREERGRAGPPGALSDATQKASSLDRERTDERRRRSDGPRGRTVPWESGGHATRSHAFERPSAVCERHSGGFSAGRGRLSVETALSPRPGERRGKRQRGSPAHVRISLGNGKEQGGVTGPPPAPEPQAPLTPFLFRFLVPNQGDAPDRVVFSAFETAGDRRRPPAPKPVENRSSLPGIGAADGNGKPKKKTNKKYHRRQPAGRSTLTRLAHGEQGESH